jgi:hypothetical protein
MYTRVLKTPGSKSNSYLNLGPRNTTLTSGVWLPCQELLLLSLFRETAGWTLKLEL